MTLPALQQRLSSYQLEGIDPINARVSGEAGVIQFPLK